jgi:hypothetical protein
MTAPYWTPAEDKETFNGIDGFYVSNITGGDMVYGQLVDDSYHTYIMFVNKDYVNGHDFNISFNYGSSVLFNAIGKVSKESGRITIENTQNDASHTITRWFAAGDGELYKVLSDSTAASTPTALIASGETKTTINIDWSNSYDYQSGLDYYVVYRDGVEIDTVTGSYFQDTDLVWGKKYTYRISAVNGEGVESALSSVLSASTLYLPGDANQDGVVDNKDATIVAANWLTSTGASWADGDFNDDGAVNERDATILAANWGDLAGSTASVPEPGMLVLFAGMFLIVGFRRRK